MDSLGRALRQAGDAFVEFVSFAPTEEFRRGVYVELGGLIVELAVLALVVPLLLHLWSRRRALSARVLLDFSVFQVHHRTSRGLLTLLNVTALAEAAPLRPHGYSGKRASTYGNLEDVVRAARQRCRDRRAVATTLASLDRRAFSTFLRDVRWARDEIDRLVPWTQGNQRLVQELHEFKTVLYVLEDWVELAAHGSRPGSSIGPARTGTGRMDHEDFARFLDMLTAHCEADFLDRRRLVDRQERAKRWWGLGWLLLEVAWIIPSRPALIALARLRRVPYRDPWGANAILPPQMRAWRRSLGLSEPEAASELGLSLTDYRNYENGYKQPTGETLDLILERATHRTGEPCT